MPTTILYEDAEQRVEEDTDQDGVVTAVRTIDLRGVLANESTIYANALGAMASMDTIAGHMDSITTITDAAGAINLAQAKQALGVLAHDVKTIALTEKGVIRVLLQRFEAVN